MGPSGSFEEGEWINENEFVVVLGYFQRSQAFRPMAWFIDCKSTSDLAIQICRQPQQPYEQDSYLDPKDQASGNLQ